MSDSSRNKLEFAVVECEDGQAYYTFYLKGNHQRHASLEKAKAALAEVFDQLQAGKFDVVHVNLGGRIENNRRVIETGWVAKLALLTPKKKAKRNEKKVTQKETQQA